MRFRHNLGRWALALSSLLLVATSGCQPGAVGGRVASAGVALHWVANMLLGQAVDDVWDKLTGKPDVAELERRIAALESDARWRADYRQPIDDLSKALTDQMTPDEYRQLVTQAIARIEEIDQRLEQIDDRVRQQEIRISQLEQQLQEQAVAQYLTQQAALHVTLPPLVLQGPHGVGVAQFNAPYGLRYMDDPYMRCRWVHIGGPPVVVFAGQQVWGELWFDNRAGRHVLQIPLYGGARAVYAAY